MSEDALLRDQILHAFCQGTERKDLADPFNAGEFTYATNGAVAVRVPRDARYDRDVSDWVAKSIQKIFETSGNPETRMVPARPYVDQVRTCTACDGRGKEHKCPSCECVCAVCKGKPVPVDISQVSLDVFGEIVDARFYKLAAALPGAQITRGAEKMQPIPFAFDGGTGLLMPRKKPAILHVKDWMPRSLLSTAG